MKIFKCDKNGIAEFDDVEKCNAYGTQAYKVIDNGLVSFIDKLPKVFLYNNDVVVYSDSIEAIKKIYNKEVNSKIEYYKSEIIKLQESITFINAYS